jgi:aspartate/methionine/tyrosine aminotransferase
MNPALFRLEDFFDEYEHVEGMTVLGTSDAWPLTLAELQELCGVELPPRLSLGYTPPAGDPDLVDAVARHYGVDADRVLITAGGNEAVFLSVVSSLEPGQRALVCRPAYQALEEAARLAGAAVMHYDYLPSRQYALDAGQLLDALDSRISLLVLNTPHNPTAKVLPDDLLDAVFARAVACGTRVIVDEVMHGIVHRGVAPSRSAARFDEAVVVGSTSKVFGLGGLRTGWIVGPRDVILRCKRWRYYTTICPSAPSQVLAAAAVRHAPAILRRNEERVRRNYEIAEAWLRAHEDDFAFVPPEGGTTMLVRFRDGRSAGEFARRLADEERVLVVPADDTFGLERGTIRLGLGSAPEALQEGLERIDRFIRRSAGR